MFFAVKYSFLSVRYEEFMTVNMTVKKTALAAMTVVASLSAHSDPVEATVASVHAQIKAGVSCESITQSF